MSQASHEFRGSVDFNDFELRNARFQLLGTFPASPVTGKLFYNSLINTPFYYNGSKWNPFGLPPVHIRYTNEAALLADQAKQIEGYIYYDIASEIYYEKLSASTSSINDYDPIGGNGLFRTKQNINTGYISGLQLSVNSLDNTKFDIAPGFYVISDYSDLTNPTDQIIQITFPITGITPTYLATSPASYVAIDADQNIIQSDSPFTNEDRRTLAILGAVIHTNNTIINVTNEIKAPIVASTNQLHDFIKAVGSLNLEGNNYGAGTTGMRLTKSAGIIWGLGINAVDYLNPHQLTIPLQTDLTFRYRLQNSTEYADTLNIDPDNYDNNGVLTPVPNNRFTVQHINLFQSGLTRIQYGQHVYQNFEEAKLLAPTETFNIEKNIADNAIFRAYLVIGEGVTDLATAIANGEAEFIPVDKFGNVVTGSPSVLTYDAIVTALGYIPEDEANKVTDFTILNNTLYPSTQAVADYVSGTQNYLTKYNFPNGITESQIFDNGTNVGIGTTDFTDPARVVISGRVSQTGLNTSTYFGYKAGLNDDLTANLNCGFGHFALKSVTSGLANNAFGYRALENVTTGILNDGFGGDVLRLTTTGSYNAAFGTNSLDANTTGQANSAFGILSLSSNTTGQYNVAVGLQASILGTTASFNTIVGARAFENNILGSNNVAVGYFVAQANSRADNSIFVGYNTRPAGNSQTNQVVIGYNVVGNGSNTVTIGNSAITKNFFWGRMQHADAVDNNESATLGQVNSLISGSTYTHPSYTPITETLSGATVLASFTSDAIGSVTGFATRTLLASDLGAELTSNKAVDFTTINNTLYPTTQAIVDYFSTRAGAGLSIDNLGKVQLGNNGAGVVNLIDFEVEDDGDIFSKLSFNGKFEGLDRFTEVNSEIAYENSLSSEISYRSYSQKNDESYYHGASIFMGTSIDPILDIGSSSINIQVDRETGFLDLTLDGNLGAIIKDTLFLKGLVYDSDYSANGTLDPRWIPDWGAVTGAIAGASHDPVTLGSPANGLSLVGQQLSIGLASSGVTGVLSGTDWNTFNGKIGGSGTVNYIPKFTASGTIGDSILINDSNGVYNTGKGNSTIFGYQAGQSDSGTNANTYYGYRAGQGNTTGNNNVFFGHFSGANNTTGSANTYLGRSAGFNNLTGLSNSFVGSQAGVSITGGNFNNIVGVQAGGSGSTANNNFFGYQVAVNRTTGNNNSMFGHQAGRLLVSGANATSFSNSVHLGLGTKVGADGATNEIVIGYLSEGRGSNTTTIGNSSTVSTSLPSGSLWVNTTSGTNTLDVNGTARIRTINNLGTAATVLLTKSATGVISERTLTEIKDDLGIFPSSFQRDKFIYSASNVFTLTRNTPNAVMVFLNGQKLQFTDDWSISGSNVTVSTPLLTDDEISIEYFYSTPDVVSSNLNGTGTANYLTKWNGTAELGVSLIQDDGSLVTLPAATDIPTVAATTDTDKFVVLDGNRLKFRTGSEVLSDIGAAASSHTQNASTILAGTFASGDFIFQGNLDVNGQISSLSNAKGNSGTGTVTFNWNDGNMQTVTLTGNCTFAFSNPQSGGVYQIIITRDATANRTINWPVGIKWGNGVAWQPSGANTIDIVTISYDGTTYFAVVTTDMKTI